MRTQAPQISFKPALLLAFLLAFSLSANAKSLPDEHLEEPIHSAAVDLPPVELPEKTIRMAQQFLNPQPADINDTALPPPDNKATPSGPTLPVILTTRPSFTDAWLTVPQGSFQVESGATYTDNSGKTRSWILPESLLKIGLTDHTEFRFSVPNYTQIRDDNAGQLTNNFGDITVGFSHHRALPGKIDLTIIPFLNIPAGANNVSTNSLDPQLRLVAARYFTPKFVVASQIDARWNKGKNALADVVLNPTGIAYYSFTDKITGFIEYGGFIPTRGKSSQFIQGGALYLLTKRQQLDLRVATGLNRNSSDFLVGAGYSFRIDGLFGTSKAYSTFNQ